MENKQGIFISIIIPTYNEESRIINTLTRVNAYLKENGYLYELILVDDGSRDRTVEMARKFGGSDITVIENGENKGKGYSVKKGALNAKGDLVFFMDADLSVPIEDMEKLLRYIKSGYDVAIASRALADSDILVPQPWYRLKASFIFRYLVRLVAVKGIQDTQCGFKCFTKEAAKEIFKRQTLNGFSFDVELLYIAQKLRFKIKEVPVRWSNNRNSRVNFIKDGLKMLFDLARIRLNRV